jgi:hypothetical protein
MIRFETTPDAVLITRKDGVEIDREQFVSVNEAQEGMMDNIRILEQRGEDYEY